MGNSKLLSATVRHFLERVVRWGGGGGVVGQSLKAPLLDPQLGVTVYLHLPLIQEVCLILNKT